MIEELFSIGSFSVSPFGFMLVLSLSAAYWQLRKMMQYYQIGDEEDASSLIFAAGFFGILGGKIYYAILFSDWRLLFDRAGIVWYGGFIGGFLAVMWTLYRRKLPVARTFDATAPGLALGYAVGRVGCFLVGDDYGRPTDLPWGMVFKVGLPRTTEDNLRNIFGVETPPELVDPDGWVAVHPTQLYETAGGLMIWGFALWLLNRGRKAGRDMAPGMLFLIVIALLSVERFLVEFVRVKDDRVLGDFTVAQAISLVILLVTAVVAWRRRQAEPAP
ncbi:MAG: prolipoprotein diacylglyceryl transferase [Acidobacteriota bacterium]